MRQKIIRIQPAYLTEEEAAIYLGLSQKTVAREAKKYHLRRYYFGDSRSFRYRLVELEALMRPR
jgi:excisionase family DNA binding protein